MAHIGAQCRAGAELTGPQPVPAALRPPFLRASGTGIRASRIVSHAAGGIRGDVHPCPPAPRRPDRCNRHKSHRNRSTFMAVANAADSGQTSGMAPGASFRTSPNKKRRSGHTRGSAMHRGAPTIGSRAISHHLSLLVRRGQLPPASRIARRGFSAIGSRPAGPGRRHARHRAKNKPRPAARKQPARARWCVVSGSRRLTFLSFPPGQATAIRYAVGAAVSVRFSSRHSQRLAVSGR